MENKIDVKKIAAQNDKFRKTFEGGKVLLTCGISALPLLQQQEIMQKVRTFNNFTEDNDPYGEHDFGCFEYRGQPKLTAQQVEEIKALINNRTPITQIAKQYGISRRTIYNYL